MGAIKNYFKHLNYTLGDEDATFEMNVLQPDCPHVVGIADCGSRIVPLLAKHPRKLTLVDISPEQLAVAILRLALVRTVDVQAYCGFLGYTDMLPEQRRSIFAALPIDEPWSALLYRMLSGIAWGPLVYEGKFERLLLTLSRVTRTVLGRATERIFECSTLEEQAEFFARHFPKRRWRLVLGVLGNSTALNALLYKGDFPKKNIDKPYFNVYDDIFRYLLTTIPARRSFFLQMVFLGKVKYAEGFPIECNPVVFSAAKRAIDACGISYVTSDILAYLAQTHEKAGFLSYSDVPSFLTDDQAYNCLQYARRTLLPGALVVVRGHVRVVKPDLTGYSDISAQYACDMLSESTGLWNIATYQAA